MSFNADDAALAIEMMNEEATADVQYSDQNAAMAEIERITTATKLLVANTMKLHGLTELGHADDRDKAGAKAITDAARAKQRDTSAYVERHLGAVIDDASQSNSGPDNDSAEDATFKAPTMDIQKTPNAPQN